MRYIAWSSGSPPQPAAAPAPAADYVDLGSLVFDEEETEKDDETMEEDWKKEERARGHGCGIRGNPDSPISITESRALTIAKSTVIGSLPTVPRTPSVPKNFLLINPCPFQ